MSAVRLNNHQTCGHQIAHVACAMGLGHFNLPRSGVFAFLRSVPLTVILTYLDVRRSVVSYPFGIQNATHRMPFASSYLAVFQEHPKFFRMPYQTAARSRPASSRTTTTTLQALPRKAWIPSVRYPYRTDLTDWLWPQRHLLSIFFHHHHQMKVSALSLLEWTFLLALVCRLPSFPTFRWIILKTSSRLVIVKEQMIGTGLFSYPVLR